MWKKTVCLVWVVLLAVLVSSCGQDYELLRFSEASVGEEPVRLRLICPWSGSDSKANTLRYVLEQYPADVEIVNESMTGEDFLMKLKTDFASGNDPDLFAIWPGANVNTLIRAGKVADLTDLLESQSDWKRQFEKSAWDNVTVDGRIYGIPLELTYQCMFLNTDMFEAYRVEIPQDFEGLKRAVNAFLASDVIPISFNAQYIGSLLYQSIIAALGGRLEVEYAFQGGQISPCYVEALAYVKELYELGAFPANAFSLSDSSAQELFYNKQAAMIVQRSEFIGEVNQRVSSVNLSSTETESGQDVPLTVDMIPFPAIQGGKGDPTALIYGLGSGTFFLSQSAWEVPKTREAAVDLLAYLTSEKIASLFSERTRMSSAVKIPPPDVYYSGLMKRGRLLIDNTKEVILPPDSIIDRSVWNNTVIKQLPYVLEGTTTAQAVWDEVIQWYQTELGSLQGAIA